MSHANLSTTLLRRFLLSITGKGGKELSEDVRIFMIEGVDALGDVEQIEDIGN